MPENYYRGSCQCGAVHYEVVVDTDHAIVCNCSRCKPMGFVLAFAPREQFRLLAGADQLSEYRFNTKRIAHLFCRTCGVESFAYGEMPNGEQIVAVNVNCLDGIDPRKLKVSEMDGRSA